ncbi:MAG: hypothetical protein JWP89_1977 [Schlesneria sp.]|nr:hypothetical protein [Schlesneria sp.]
MSFEILYTSAPSGLRPGSSGYCTVLSSRGVPAPTVELLETLSGYRHLFPLGHPQALLNPVNFGHYVMRISGRREHVLSRVSDFKLDYTGRSNKLAHHIVVDEIAAVPTGPAWLLKRPDWIRDNWNGEVGLSDGNRIPAPEVRSAVPCSTWARVAGDAGWAGVLAESFLADPNRKVFLIYQPGTDVLALFDEAIALLPESKRWDVTFATFGAALPATVECLWNGVVAGSAEVDQSRKFINALRIDLTAKNAKAQGGALVTAARTGITSATQLSVSRIASPPKLPKNTVDREMSEDVLESTTTLNRPAGQRDRKIPPSLPSARARSATQTDAGVMRYITGAIVGGAVIAIIVSVVLMSPKPEPTDTNHHLTELTSAENQTPIIGVQGTSLPASVPVTGHASRQTPTMPTTPNTANDDPDKTATPPATVQSSGDPPANIPPPGPQAAGHEKKREDEKGGKTKVSNTPLAICTKTRVKAENGDQWQTSFVFSAKSKSEAKSIRFLVPVDSNNKVVASFASATAKVEAEPANENTVVLEITKAGKQWDDNHAFKVSIPTAGDSADNRESFDLQSESEVVMTGPRLDKVLAFAFSGCVLEGERPNLMLFHAPPLHWPGPLVLHRAGKVSQSDGKAELYETPLLGIPDGNRDKDVRDNADHLKNDLLRYVMECPNLLAIHDLVVTIPNNGEISWGGSRNEKGEPLIILPDESLGSNITLTFSVTTKSESKSDGSPKLCVTISPTREDLKNPVTKSMEMCHKEWGTLFSSAIVPDKRLVNSKTEESLDELDRLVSPNPNQSQSPVQMKAKHLIEEKRKLVRQSRQIEDLYEQGLAKMQIASARVGHSLMELEHPEHRRFQVDLVVIGTASTEIDYLGWNAARKTKK